MDNDFTSLLTTNLRLDLASTFKFDMMCALAPGRHLTIVAGVSICTFRTMESPITRALSLGFSVGASLRELNLFDVGTDIQCFLPPLDSLTVTQPSLCEDTTTRAEQCEGHARLVTFKF